MASLGGLTFGSPVKPSTSADTVHCLTVDAPDETAIAASVQKMVSEVQEYVPGYSLKNGPVFDGTRVSIYMEVEGLGDFLPNQLVVAALPGHHGKDAGHISRSLDQKN